MKLTFMAQNILNGAINAPDGSSEDRWSILAERINGVKPAVDFLLLSEVQYWDRKGYQQLARAMRDLDMESLPFPPSHSGKHVALFYRRSTVGRWHHWNTEYAWDTTHGFGVGAFDVGLPDMLSVVPVHIDPFRKEKAISEIGLIANRAYRYGPFAIIGGDCNYAPARGPEPDYKAMRPFNRAARSIHVNRPEEEEPKGYKGIARALENAGFTDVAYHLYEQTGEKSSLQRTAGEDRIDQFWVTKPLARGVASYHVVDSHPKASDHKGIVFELDTDKVDMSAKLDYS